jgi:hypothetical protein
MEELVMKRILVGLTAALAFPALALAQTPDQNKAAGNATEQAVPEMKNPGGTDKLHPPQKAMDEATPAAPGKEDSSTGASSGDSGSSTFNAEDAKKDTSKPEGGVKKY